MCQQCADAIADPRSEQFRAGCEGCTARALAATGAHLESKKLGRMTPVYRGALDKLFGDRAADGHKAVMEWAGRVSAWDLAKSRGM